MSTSLRSVGAITLFVEDARRSRRFYENVLDAEVAYEDDNAVTFKLENTLLNRLRRTEADELVAPARVATPDAGSSFQLTIWVGDVDAVCGELERRGISLNNGPVDRPWGVRTATFADPDGHVWEAAQQLAQPSGRPGTE